MTNYEELADRVEAGEDMTGVSREAAEVLHNAILPGWSWQLDWSGKPYASVVPQGHDLELCRAENTSHGKTPAAAWVAAILRAKASMEEAND